MRLSSIKFDTSQTVATEVVSKLSQWFVIKTQLYIEHWRADQVNWHKFIQEDGDKIIIKLMWYFNMIRKEQIMQSHLNIEMIGLNNEYYQKVQVCHLDLQLDLSHWAVGVLSERNVNTNNISSLQMIQCKSKIEIYSQVHWKVYK